MNVDLLIFLIFLTPALATMIWPIRTAFTSKPVLLAHWDLAAMQLFTSLAIVFFAANNYGILSHSYLGDVLYTLASVFVLPFYYMFLCELTRHQGATLRDRRVAFMPPILFCIIFTIIVFQLGDDKYTVYAERVLLHKDYSITHDFYYDAMHIFGYWGYELMLFLQVVCFITVGFVRLRRYRFRLVEYNPSLRGKAKGAFMVAGLVFLSSLVVFYVIMNPYPTTIAEMGVIYLLLMAYSAFQFLMGQYADQLDISVKQMLMTKRDSDVLRKTKMNEQ